MNEEFREIREAVEKIEVLISRPPYDYKSITEMKATDIGEFLSGIAPDLDEVQRQLEIITDAVSTLEGGE